MSDIFKFEELFNFKALSKLDNIDDELRNTEVSLDNIYKETENYSDYDFLNAVQRDYLQIIERKDVFDAAEHIYLLCMQWRAKHYDSNEISSDKHFFAHSYITKWSFETEEDFTDWKECFERDFAYLSNVVKYKRRKHFFNAIFNIEMLGVRISICG